MKIDPNIQFPIDPQSDRVTNSASKTAPLQGSTSSSSATSTNAEDTFNLSSTHATVQTLTASVANVPEVRTQRVSSLQQKVNSGTYQPSSQNIADAIIADQSGRKT